MSVATTLEGSAQASLFEYDGSLFHPTRLAIGPWDKRYQSGVVVNALVAHAVEQTGCPASMTTARLVTDIMKPTLMAPVEPRVRIVREGKRLQLLELELIQDSVATVRASALRVRTTSSPATVQPVHAVPAASLPSLSGNRSPLASICETRLESGGLESLGPGVVWAMITGEIVPGTPISPFVALAMAADMASGTSSIVDWRAWSFANVDISLHLSRMPQAGWLRVAATTQSAGNGVAVVDARLADEQGDIGHAHQTLFLDRRA